MNDKLDIILSKLESLEKGQQGIQQDVTDIKNAVVRLEQSEPANVLAVLDRIEKKLESKSNIYDVSIKDINFKVENLESDLRLVKKLLTN